MPDQLDIDEAEARLFQLVERVESGEEIVLARDGRPVAKIVPVRPRTDSACE